MKDTLGNILVQITQADKNILPDIERVLSGELRSNNSGGRGVLNNQQTAPILVTKSAAARILGISRTTFYKLLRQGLIKVVEISPGCERICMEELQKFGHQHRREHVARKRGGKSTRSEAGNEQA